ncbi:HNH endonuclease signature motif containing protein, partial [Escherichia coli]|nr:HNH endonuclease signature motif containing protein [Escherichia coli]
GGTTDGDGSHGSTSKTPSYTKSVSWQHHPPFAPDEGHYIGPKETLKKFQIHHFIAIEYGGGVYDIDNLRIVTPRLHDEIHYRR